MKFIWESFRDHVLDKIWVGLFTHIHINYQKTILTLLIVTLVFALAFSFYNFHEDGWDIAIIHSIKAIDQQTGENDSATSEIISNRWNWQQVVSSVFWVIAVFLFLAYILLYIEKKNNQKLHFDTRRKLDAFNAGFACALFSFVQKHQQDKLRPEEWVIPASSEKQRERYLINQTKQLSDMHIELYNAICHKIGIYIGSHIREKNPNDIVHISIKAFVKTDTNELKVINFGESNEEADPRAVTMPTYTPSLEIRMNDGYLISSDYAMTRVLQNGQIPEIFICPDIKEFRQRTNGNDRAGNYRIPPQVTRNFNATIVCPITSVGDDPANGYNTIGALCVDTTSRYDDWQTHDSFEEQLVNFASACIAPLLFHNIKEIAIALDLLGFTK